MERMEEEYEEYMEGMPEEEEEEEEVATWEAGAETPENKVVIITPNGFVLKVLDIPTRITKELIREVAVENRIRRFVVRKEDGTPINPEDLPLELNEPAKIVIIPLEKAGYL